MNEKGLLAHKIRLIWSRRRKISISEREKVVFLFAFIYTLLFDLVPLYTYYSVVAGPAGMQWYWPHLARYLVITGVHCFAASFFLFAALVSHRLLFMLFTPIVFVLGAVLSYYIAYYQVTFTPEMISAIYASPAVEAIEFVSLRLMIWVLVALLVSLWVIGYYRKKRLVTGWWYSAFIAVLLSCYLYSSAGRFGVPFNFISASIDYWVDDFYRQHVLSQRTNIAEIAPVSYNPKAIEKMTVVLVIGESARADHWHLNGYPRETTPWVEKIPNLVNFSQARSCANGTDQAVSCLLTRSTPENMDPTTTETSFLSIFKKAGFHVFWLSNNNATRQQNFHIRQLIGNAAEVDKIYSTRVHGSIEFLFANFLFSSKDEHRSTMADADLFPYLDPLLIQYPGKVFIVLHLSGSHWAYSKRYPPIFNHFKPICEKYSYAECTRDSVINAYDNSIRYTDYFLNEVIERLKGRNAMVWYASDHGELLGERGLWNHLNQDKGPEQYHIPMFWWASDHFIKQNPAILGRMNVKKNDAVSHSNLFHSILDCASIKSTVIDTQKSFCQ